MSNLTLFKQPDSLDLKLTRTENLVASAIIASEVNPRICDMTESQMARIVTTICVKAAIRLGSRPKDEEEQGFISMEINSDLVRKFPKLTEKEILRALENGLDGVYKRKPEDPIIFTPSNFVQWVRYYVEETKRPVMKKVAQIAQQMPSEEETISEPEQLKMSLESFLDTFRRVLDGKTYEDYGNVVYSFLDRIGFMRVSVEEKWKAIDMAKLRMIAEAKETKGLLQMQQAVKGAMEQLDRMEKEGPDEFVKSIAKKILVSQKLKEYSEMEVEDQTSLLESIKERVEYMCIELAEPETYQQEEQ